MLAPDEEALEAAAWQDFVRRLGAQLASLWPAMPARLGDRYDAFVELATQQAGERGLQHAPAVARFVNLWFVWGPAFHDKPGFQWAQGILAGPPGREWLVVHQLVKRSLVELERLPGARIEPAMLAAADTLLIERFGLLGARGRMRRHEALELPRAACDLEAADLRQLDDGWQREYRLVEGEWRREPVAAPPALRVDGARPMPARVSLLTHADGEGPLTRLQVRLRPHAVCSVDVHPRVHFEGPHGRWTWAGHETRAVSWPLRSRTQALPAPGAGVVVAEETSPELQRLRFETCGLRDEGDAIGSPVAVVAAWPAEQWWVELQRAVPNPQPLLPGPRAWVRGPTRCRVEREGQAADTAALKRHFEEGLDGELAVGLQKLAAAWEQLPGLKSAAFEATLGLLVGRFAATWGWRLGSGGLDGDAVMRLVAQFEQQACQAELLLTGQLELDGSTSRVELKAGGQAPLRCELVRESAQPPLTELLLASAQVQWRFPFTLALDPVAQDSPALLQMAAPATGALVGAAGLKPCSSGTSGWEWFARLSTEAVTVRLQGSDPVLGDSDRTLTLLPALTLVDWKAG